MAQDLEQIGIDSVNQFLETWNSRDPQRWADSLNFPHVRPSPFGEVGVAPTAEDYIAHVDFQAVQATGWDHSEWDYKHVLHTSPRKIHTAGQWSRYSASGEVILTTPIVYIITRSNGHWGIQSRFGSDYAHEDVDSTELMTRGLNLVQDFVNQHNTGNRESCAEMLNYPHFSIGVGELDITRTSAEFTPGNFSMKIESLQALQTGIHSLNAGIELTISDEAGSTSLQGIVNINKRDDHLGIQAWSLLDPNEESEG